MYVRKGTIKSSTCTVKKNVIERGIIAFLEIYVFCENHSLEFHKIWHKNTLMGSNWNIENKLKFNREILDTSVS